MTGPDVRFVDLAAGRYRYLEWPGLPHRPPALLLHGLSALADAWEPTVAALGPAHGRVLALDQRGHGESPSPSGRGAYTALRMALDVVEFCDAAGLDRPHLAGHSMGGRVAIVLAARFPRLFRSLTVVDIGPEAWATNLAETVQGIQAMPAEFPSREEAVAFVRQGRDLAAEEIERFLRRLRPGGDGGLRWKGSRDAMLATVTTQRLRSYWREWEAIALPALFIRGERTREVRERVAQEMRARNPAVRYAEIEGVGHNIPARAPIHLAGLLERFWAAVEGGEAQG